MKLKFRVLIAILLCATMLFAFAACNRVETEGNLSDSNQVEPVGDLSAEQVGFVRKSYYDTFENKEKVDIDDIVITNYLGTYHDNIVVILRYLPKGVNVGAVVVPVYVDDVFITELGTSAYKIIVCTPQGQVYNLQSAYEAGLILYDDLPLISEIAESRWDN